MFEVLVNIAVCAGLAWCVLDSVAAYWLGPY
jgi:hypothetical protein